MALEAHHIQEAREEVEAEYGPRTEGLTKLLLDSFQFKILELIARSHESTSSYHEKRITECEKAQAKLSYTDDVLEHTCHIESTPGQYGPRGPDGCEACQAGQEG